MGKFGSFVFGSAITLYSIASVVWGAGFYAMRERGYSEREITGIVRETSGLERVFLESLIPAKLIAFEMYNKNN